VRRIVGEQDFAGGVGKLSVSAGVCELAQAVSAPELMRLADGALYWAKASGRDLTVHYSPGVVQELSAAERAERLARSQAVTALRALARAVDAKDPSTARHSERVAEVAVELATAMGWDADRIGLLNEAALLHDVGKIGLPDALLLTAGPFDAEERAQVEGHAALGAEIVSDVLTPEQVAWVRGHHERWDGGGYPDRLAGDDIPEGARILAVADAWDAMTSVRTYQNPIPGAAAVDECRRCAGITFAPSAVEALVRLWESRGLPPTRSTKTADAAR
jgi:putative nucleotidyltransferase with HDIG domain